jgi:hypothetical protein
MRWCRILRGEKLCEFHVVETHEADIEVVFLERGQLGRTVSGWDGCELNGADPFDYLNQLQRHAEELKQTPSEWMPWTYPTPFRCGGGCWSRPPG